MQSNVVKFNVTKLSELEDDASELERSHGHLDSNNRLTLVAEHLEKIECEFNENGDEVDHLPRM
jgi:hypothetical protein